MTDAGRASSSCWQRFRELMPISERWAYLDHAAVSPLPSRAREAILAWSIQATEQGDVKWPDWVSQVERARLVAASLINADVAEVAFVPNTTTGISLVAEGFPWRPGDNVVTLANEFPSNIYPWMNLASRGVETRRVPVEGAGIDVARIAAVCDERTRVLSISWVGFLTGWRVELGPITRMAHERGMVVFLDAIQGLGVFPLDVHTSGVDFLAADGHKWLLGPEGAGILFVRREHLDRLRPLGVGWNSVVHSHDYTKIDLAIRPTAARYEGGSQNMCGLLGLGASLQMLSEFGLRPTASPLAERVKEVTDYACRRLVDFGAEIISDRREAHWSGIVAFDLPGRDPLVMRRRCLEAGVVLSCRGGHLRISPHAYSREEDIDRLIESLERSMP